MSHDIFLGSTVFIACLVEMVEALTIVLALGITRGWRSVLLATGAAIVSLAAMIAVFGAALTQIASSGGSSASPTLRHLWLVLGTLLLIFGLQWVRKAVLRFAGLLATRDEDAAFKKLRHEATRTGKRPKEAVDWYSFVAAYKGVLLEGFEVIFIVITFGAAQENLRLGVQSALLALAVIVVLGLVVHRPLSRVPENAMKLAVGILLTTFGTYFAVRGTGSQWPHGDAVVWPILVFYAGLSYGLIKWLRAAVTRKKRAV